MDNRQDNKRIAKNTVFLYFRQILVMAITLYTSRLVLKELGAEDFGIYNVIGGFVALLSVVTGSLSAAMSRYYTYELGRNDIDKLKLVFSTSICVLIFFSFFIFIIGELLGDWAIRELLVIPEYRLPIAYVVLQTSLVTFILNLFSSSFTGAIIAYEKMKAFAYFGIADALFRLIIAYSLQESPFDKLATYSILQTFLSLLLLIFYLFYSKTNLEGCSLSVKFDKTIMFSMSRYATWSMFGSMAYVGYTYGYNIILNVFFGPIVNAARGISVQVQSAITSFANNFQASMNPQIIKNYANNHLDRMHELVFASSRYSYYLMLLLALPMVLEADVILGVWLVEVPPHSVNFVRLVLVIMCIDVLAGPMICSQNATGDVKLFQVVTGISMLLSLPMCYIGFKMGASPEFLFYNYALFSILTQIIRVFITCPFIGISIKDYLKKVIINISVVSFVSLPIPLFFFFITRNINYRFILICIICFISVAVSVFYVGMNKNERLVIKVKIGDICSRLLKHRE